MIFCEYRTHESMIEATDMDIMEVDIYATGYRDWMMHKMRAATHYRILFDVLHDTEFEWEVEWDEHRASDGRNLRRRYEDETGKPPISDPNVSESFLISYNDNWPCSFLEMLIALAYTIEDRIMYDPDQGDRTYLWFWEMMTNIGLDICTDEWFDSNGLGAMEYVDEAVWRVMHHDYGKNGYGGLFPLEACTDVNMREQELWVQANAYFLDRSVA